MLEIGGLVFSSPWMLAALAGLPVLWWLLRVTPPSPRLVSFPPLRFLLALRPEEETPATTPWWLVLLRILVAALIILALSHPLLNPGVRLYGSGPVILVVDNGWSAAADWPARQRKIDELLDRAERQGRPVHFMATAAEAPDAPVNAGRLMRAAEAKALAADLSPKPWPVDRTQALAAARSIRTDGSAHAFWIADGLGGDEATEELAEFLQSLGNLTVIEQPAAARARLVRAPVVEGEALSVPVSRVPTPSASRIRLRAVSEDGRLIAREDARFAENAGTATVRMALPAELRNEIGRLEIEGGRNAGEVFLMDERWRRRPVGIVSGDASEAEQPLLSSIYYLERALGPFAETRRGSVAKLLEREISVIVLADIGKILETDARVLEEWMSNGGVTLRFAGPKLASGGDELIPVRLRRGGRVLGGAMSWAEPARLLPFEEAGPFAGLPAPRDVRIRRQVLAEPGIDLNRKTWARLADGTPLVTADERGRGWLVLVHTTANTDWSNLPISGLFVEMLRRIVGLSAGVGGEDGDALLPPLMTMDGYGRPGPPSADAASIPAREFGKARPSPATPPGYYGRENGRRALNLLSAVQELAPIGELPSGIERRDFSSRPAVDFKPWLLLAALILAMADLVAGLALRGLLRVGAAGLALLAALPEPAQADPSDTRALEATLTTRLAYVRTGDAELDGMTVAGLRGLSGILERRTSIEPGSPLAVDIEADELAFFPSLYWAVSPRQPRLSESARDKLNRYLKTGGSVFFDTGEQGGFLSDVSGGVGSAGLRLRQLLQGLDIPPLIRAPPDHVLTRSYYLLDDFPGRWAGGAVWVERRGGRHNDGVSSILVGANDWAGAWAVDEAGRPLAAAVPGGERQREFAYRFGVNWVMYVLTGNYKTDQVHVPAIVERLGQ